MISHLESSSLAEDQSGLFLSLLSHTVMGRGRKERDRIWYFMYST